MRIHVGAEDPYGFVEIGIKPGRFLWSVLVASDAPTQGQLVIVPMTSATCCRSSSVVSSSALSASDRRSIAAPYL